MITITQLCPILQTLLTTDANELAQESGLIQRQRKISEAGLAQAWVLGGLAQADGTRKQWHQRAMQAGMRVSVQALDQRFTTCAIGWIRSLLERAFTHLVRIEQARCVLPQFNGVYLTDCTHFLQSYSRSMGRGGLSRDAKVKTDHYCRGLLLSTGETTIEGEASVLSRMLVLAVPPWEKRDPNGEALAIFESYRAALPSFTAQFIQWIACQADGGTLQAELSERFNQNAKGYSYKLRSNLPKQAHTGRMIQNWAVLVTTYQMLHKFLIEREEDTLLPTWHDSLLETVQAVQQERASEVFMNLLGQLIAGGQCVIEESLRGQFEPTAETTVVGYRDEGFVYLLPDVVLKEVNRIQGLRFTVYAIGSQLSSTTSRWGSGNRVCLSTMPSGAD